MGDFKIRLMTTKEELESVVIVAMEKEHWRPGLHDAECFLECDPTGFFVGELNGKPICCVSMTKYGDNYAFCGCYVVSEEYRGLGKGVKISNAALASINASCNLGVYAVERLQNIYQKKHGLHNQWPVTRYDLDVVTTLKNLGEEATQDQSFAIKSINDVDLQAIFCYDTEVFGFSRQAFLSKWLCAQGSHVGVAIDCQESVVGYTVVRPTFEKKHGYMVGPLFANSSSIAKRLLRATLQTILEEEISTVTVCIDVPAERNIAAKQLIKSIQGKLVDTFFFMTRKGEPKACFEKWFGVTTLQLG